MNFVQPIRDPLLVEEMANYLRSQNERDYIMFMIGINAGLRISDILKLKVVDVRDRSYISLRETKTKKQRLIKINPALRKALASYIEGKDSNEYLIKSREGNNKPLSRGMAYKILRKAATKFDIESMGTHTLRKTFGYHFYKKYKDIAYLQDIFNHSDPAITLRYIGINQENMDDLIDKFKIF